MHYRMFEAVSQFTVGVTAFGIFHVGLAIGRMMSLNCGHNGALHRGTEEHGSIFIEEFRYSLIEVSTGI